MKREFTSRRSMLRTLGGVGVVGLAGCTSDDDSTDASGDDDPYDTSTDVHTSTDEGREMADQATIALSTDLTAGVWQVYGGVMPYYSNVLEPLIWVTDDMGLEPWLATDWEATSDTTWEFTLREDVTFHNGEPLTADDVVFSFGEILNEWAWAPGWLHLDPETSVTKVDDKTVEFTNTGKFPSFPGTIAHNMVAIQHSDRDRESNEVIGTGPFEVVDRKQEQYVQTEAFDEYWNESPKLSKLRFRVITDPNTRALSLTGGEVDVAYEPPKNKVSSLKDDESTEVHTQLEPSAGYAGLNIHKSPTDDADLRRALNYTVPQELIVEEVLNGIGKPAKGPIADSIYWSGHEKLPEYGPDVEKAQDLVDQSSYGGETLKLLVSNNMTDGRLLAQVLQQQFDEIGVSLEIQQMEDAAFDDAVRNGEGHLNLRAAGTNSGAADYLMYDTFHSQGDVNQRLKNKEDTGLYNLGGEVDDLIEQGYQTADADEKENVYESALVEIMEQAVVVPLYYAEYVVGASSNVENIDLRPIPEMARWTGLANYE